MIESAALLSAPLTEFAVRDYLRTRSAVKSCVGNDSRRIDLDYSGTGNYLVMYRAGGAPRSTLPLDTAILTFHCYGSTRHAAALLEAALVTVLQSLNAQNLNDDTYCQAASVLSRGAWLPTSDGRARYIVTAGVTARRVA